MERQADGRRVRIGCTFVQVAEVETPTIFLVEPVQDGTAQLLDEEWRLQPEIAGHDYRDLYGNRCRRLTLPVGRSVIEFRATRSRRPRRRIRSRRTRGTGRRAARRCVALHVAEPVLPAGHPR